MVNDGASPAEPETFFSATMLYEISVAVGFFPDICDHWAFGLSSAGQLDHRCSPNVNPIVFLAACTAVTLCNQSSSFDE